MGNELGVARMSQGQDKGQTHGEWPAGSTDLCTWALGAEGQTPHTDKQQALRLRDLTRELLNWFCSTH